MPCVDLDRPEEITRGRARDSDDQVQALCVATQSLVQVINTDLVAVGGTLELLLTWVDLPENLRELTAAAKARLVNMADHVQDLQTIAAEAADSRRGQSSTDRLA